jgi:hypothetical protein
MARLETRDFVANFDIDPLLQARLSGGCEVSDPGVSCANLLSLSQVQLAHTLRTSLKCPFGHVLRKGVQPARLITGEQLGGTSRANL